MPAPEGYRAYYLDDSALRSIREALEHMKATPGTRQHYAAQALDLVVAQYHRHLQTTVFADTKAAAAAFVKTGSSVTVTGHNAEARADATNEANATAARTEGVRR